MIERDVIVTTKYGQMPAFAVCPEGAGPFPGVLFYMDAGGIREELRNMARRIAKQGYYCLLPDLYYRLGTLRFDIPRREETMSAVIRPCVQSLTNEKMMDDTAGMLAFLDAQDKVKPGPVGALGFCMGGKYVVLAAKHYAERIAAAASLYGISLVTDKEDSPHRLLPEVKGELYFGFGGDDNLTPPQLVADLKAALTAAGVAHGVDVFPGAKHGYCFAEKEVYAHAAAETTWQKMFDLWERRLKNQA